MINLKSLNYYLLLFLMFMNHRAIKPLFKAYDSDRSGYLFIHSMFFIENDLSNNNLASPFLIN